MPQHVRAHTLPDAGCVTASCVQARVTELASSALSTFMSRVAATIFNLTPASAQMGTAGALQVSCTDMSCPAAACSCQLAIQPAIQASAAINQSVNQVHISSMVLGVCPRRSCILFLHVSLF